MDTQAGRIRSKNPKTPRELRDIFETQFNDILISGSNPSTQLCVNTKSHPTFDIPRSNTPDYPYPLRAALIVFHACHSTGVQECGYPACVASMDYLRSVMPPCPTWAGLERWALQVAACFCFGKANRLYNDTANLADKIFSIKEGELPELLAPEDMSYRGKPAPFADWARQVNPFEVTTLLCWVLGLLWGAYWDPSTCLPELAQFNGYREKAMVQAKSRADKLHLCLHRVWAIASILPGRESNISALVPYKHSPCSYKHDYCSTGLSHKNCTYNYCEISSVNFTNVVQCHRPACDGKCANKRFPVHLLDKAANEDRPTAWAIDGELRPLEAGERYMAISHVWSDGTGGSGSVNECMYNFFCEVARKLECRGLWWDAICIPQDKHARAKAIGQMHEYYSQAACTVVHDACLAMSEWVDGNHAAFALVMSNWFTRGWTALELARSKHVWVLFSGGSTGYALKNLDVDIVSGRAIVSSMSRQAATTAIQSLRQNRRLESINDVLTALGPRFTSWARDRAIIAGQFVGIETLANDQRSIYQQIVCKIGKISSEQLFHPVARPTGPFSWLPSSLFDLPVSQRVLDDIKVFNDGSLYGEWGIILLPLDFEIFWEAIHPMSRCDVWEALKDDRHIILFEPSMVSITRGLLVKVMDDASSPLVSCDILCRYVGPLHFAPLQLDENARQLRHFYVLISSSGTDLDTGVSAANHILSFKYHGMVVQFRQGFLQLAAFESHRIQIMSM